MDSPITVLVATSPIPSHPSTEIIRETIDSVTERLPNSTVMIMADGVREEQLDRRTDYLEYRNHLAHLAERRWDHVYMMPFHKFLHQSGMTKMAIRAVDTPYVMFVEHDTPLVGEIPFEGMCGALDSDHVNLIRLSHEAEILEPHKHLMLSTSTINGVPLTKTIQWSQRPHLARTDFYSWLMNTYFGKDARTMIEDCVYGALFTEYKEHGMEGWAKFKTWLYTPDGDIKRSTHLDGRAGEPKYSNLWLYDGETPFGAPSPRRSNDE